MPIKVNFDGHFYVIYREQVSSKSQKGVGL